MAAHTSRARCAEIALETRVACAPLSSGPAVLALHRDRLPMRRAVLLLGAVLLLVVHTSGQQYRRRQPRRPGGPRKPASDEEDYYKILGVPRSADDRAIKKGAQLSHTRRNWRRLTLRVCSHSVPQAQR